MEDLVSKYQHQHQLLQDMQPEQLLLSASLLQHQHLYCWLTDQLRGVQVQVLSTCCLTSCLKG
jgi:hypothetical protein